MTQLLKENKLSAHSYHSDPSEPKCHTRPLERWQSVNHLCDHRLWPGNRQGSYWSWNNFQIPTNNNVPFLLIYKNVRFIFNYGLTNSIKIYEQQIGRAGRDNKLSKCILFYKHGNLVRTRMLIDKKRGWRQK